MAPFPKGKPSFVFLLFSVMAHLSASVFGCVPQQFDAPSVAPQRYHHDHKGAQHESESKVRRTAPATMNKTLAFNPIRITPYFLFSLEDRISFPDQIRILESSIVGYAIQKLANVFQVERVKGNLTLSPNCGTRWTSNQTVNYLKCQSCPSSSLAYSCPLGSSYVQLPQEHFQQIEICSDPDNVTSCSYCNHNSSYSPLQVGITETDHVIYFQAASSDCQQSLAFATTCYRDQSDRPIASLVNICPALFSNYNFSSESSFIETVMIHEMLHALGFSKQMFPFFRDCATMDENGICPPRTSRLENGLPVTYPDASNTTVRYGPDGTFIITPKTVALSAQYFGCSSVSRIGVPLEDEGTSRTVAQHWEARAFYSDILTSSLSPSSLSRYVLSHITLAVFEDSGWYLPIYNTSLSEGFTWGQNAGCELLSSKNCTSHHLFCSGRDVGCEFENDYKAVCSQEDYMNGCRIFKPFQDGSCASDDSFRTSSSEFFGPSSQCFSGVRANKKGWMNATSLCLRSQCIGSASSLLYITSPLSYLWDECVNDSLRGFISEGFPPYVMSCSSSHVAKCASMYRNLTRHLIRLDLVVISSKPENFDNDTLMKYGAQLERSLFSSCTLSEVPINDLKLRALKFQKMLGMKYHVEMEVALLVPSSQSTLAVLPTCSSKNISSFMNESVSISFLKLLSSNEGHDESSADTTSTSTSDLLLIIFGCLCLGIIFALAVFYYRKQMAFKQVHQGGRVDPSLHNAPTSRSRFLVGHPDGHFYRLRPPVTELGETPV